MDSFRGQKTTERTSSSPELFQESEEESIYIERNADHRILLDFSDKPVDIFCQFCKTTNSYRESDLLCKLSSVESPDGEICNRHLETYFQCRSSSCNMRITMSSVRYNEKNIFRDSTRTYHKMKQTKDWSRNLMIHYLKQNHEKDCPVGIICRCSNGQTDVIPVPTWNCKIERKKTEEITYTCPICIISHTMRKEKGKEVILLQEKPSRCCIVM